MRRLQEKSCLTMTSRMLSSFTPGILVLFLFSVTSVNSHQVITSISGRHVPVHLTHEHFNKTVTASDQDKNITYELSNNNLKKGTGVSIHLQLDVRPSPVKHSSAPRTVTLNGNARATPLVRLKTLISELSRAKSYNIIVDDQSGKILSETGNGTALAPLHNTELLGIFANKGAFSKRDPDRPSDLRILDKDQRLANSSSFNDTLLIEEDKNFGQSRITQRSFAGVSIRQTQGSCANGTTHYLEIAVAYDNTFCTLFNNEENVATQAVQELVDESNEAYGINTCIQLALVHVEAHCNDPNDPYKEFTTFSSSQILDNFQRVWIQSRRNVERDAAYLVTGFMDGTPVAGEAFVGAACSLRSAFGWVEGPSKIVFAHEVGHTIGGSHTSPGIMSETVSSSTPFIFTGASVAEFADFVDNQGGSTCMGTTRQPNDSRGTDSPSTTMPPATPVKTSSESRKTCASRFARNRALLCRDHVLRRVSFSEQGSPVGNLTIALAQRNGRFIVRYLATDQLFIAIYRDFVTTDENLLGNLGHYETGMKGKRVESLWEAGEMPLPTGAHSCCGQDLFIDLDVWVCLSYDGRILCKRIRNTYTNQVSCRNSCRYNPSGVFTPMSADQECPSCTSKLPPG